MVRSASWTAAAVLVVIGLVGSGVLVQLANGPSLGRGAGVSLAAAVGVSRPAPSVAFVPRPVLGVLAELNATVAANNATFDLNFTVPSGVWDVVYVWSLGGGLGTPQPPVLPSGMNLTENLGSAGAGFGNLSAGSYATSLTYPGWTNEVSIAVLGVFDGAGATYRFGATTASNPNAFVDLYTASLSLPAGAVEYLGVVGTGGYAIANWSMPIVDLQAAAWGMPGYTQVIGLQSSDTIWETTAAAGLQLVGVGVYPSGPVSPGPDAVLLAGLSLTAGGNNLTFPVNFTVPTGVWAVIYLWTLAGGLATYQPPVLPGGLHVVEYLENTGIAFGNLSAGTYTSSLSYAGWTNTVSIAVYGVFYGAGASYRFGNASVSNPNPFNATVSTSLVFPPNGVQYLGAEATGGYPIATWSMPIVDEETPAWHTPGYTGVIGEQHSNVLSGASAAHGLSIVGLWISNSVTNVTFSETGLKPGARWTAAVDGLSQSSSASSIVLRSPAAPVPYLLAGPRGYQVSGLAPSGTLALTPGNRTVSFTFVKGPTLTFGFGEKGLRAGSTWCMMLGGLSRCSSTTSLKVGNLTAGTYPYAVASPTSGQQITAKIGKIVEPANGTYDLLKSTTLSLSFFYPYEVTFNESGLATGTWSVTVKGHTGTAAAGTAISFLLGNGTYAYKIGAVPGYESIGSPVKLLVAGAPATVSVTFALKA